MDWHRLENDRQMPWKGEKDPYRIWLSEVILQQTRVEQGRAYYERFLEAFPSIAHLAAAPETKVFKLWEGLGYYSRCRNLIATARQITQNRNGEFPNDLEGLKKLKGVGPYTAAAIASFAFNLPHAVVDGNVMRVLSRYFGHAEPVDGPDGKKLFSGLAQQLLDKQDPAGWNQAIMDLGATVCKPRSPLCNDCPLRTRCVARRQDRVGELPVKAKKADRRKRYIYYLVFERRGAYVVGERTGKDIWRHLHDFPHVETKAPMATTQLWKAVRKLDPSQPIKMPEGIMDGPRRQLLTHQEVEAIFLRIKAGNEFVVPEGYRWVTRKAMAGLAFPRLIVSFLTEKG
jgi:A/G-specific adenine glycosylase